MDKNKNIRCLFLNPAPSLIKYGMHWGMGKIGCDSYLFDYGEDHIFGMPDDYQLAKIEDKINEQKTNLIFCEGYNGMPVKGIVDLCKKYGVQFHFWDIESPVTPGIALNMLDKCDFMWSTCIEYSRAFVEKGYKSDVLLFACNNDFHKPGISEYKFEHDISVVGSNYSNRYDKVREFVIPLVTNGFDIKFYGLCWEDETRPVNLLRYPGHYWTEPGYGTLPYEWLGAVIASSKIMIGLNCSDESETQTSCRPYETLAWSDSTVYLAWYTKAQDNIFGDYIYQAHDRHEMIDMAKEILSLTDEQRQEIARAARKFVHENHNYKLRAQQVVDKFYELGEA
jgi:spore maturation protein CgeB